MDRLSPKQRSALMARIRGKNTRPEMIVRRMVHKMKFRFRLHRSDLPGKPDLVFPRLRKVINVSGCFWHMHGCARCRVPSSHRRYWIAKLRRNAARDKRVRRSLRLAGWEVLVVWECQLSPPRLDRMRTKISSFLAVR